MFGRKKTYTETTSGNTVHLLKKRKKKNAEGRSVTYYDLETEPDKSGGRINYSITKENFTRFFKRNN